MSHKLTPLLLIAALPLGACIGQTQTASRESTSPSTAPHNDVDNNAPPVAPDQVPGPGYTGTPDDPPAAPTGAAAGQNGAALGGSAGPSQR